MPITTEQRPSEAPRRAGWRWVLLPLVLLLLVPLLLVFIKRLEFTVGAQHCFFGGELENSLSARQFPQPGWYNYDADGVQYYIVRLGPVLYGWGWY